MSIKEMVMSELGMPNMNLNTNFDLPSMADIARQYSSYSRKPQQLPQPQQQLQQQPPVSANNNVVQSADGNYIDGAKRYNLPTLKHGTRDSTTGLVIHRTAGHGFHTPTDPRAIQKGLGAQLTIDRKGNIYQIGDLNDKMWHAGSGYNGNSIGIELTGKHLNGDQWEPLTPAQQSAFIRTAGNVITRYGLKRDNIYNHAAIAAKTAGEGLAAKNYLLANYDWGN